MKENIYNLMIVATLAIFVTGCGEEAEVTKEDPTLSVSEETSPEPEMQNEGLYDLKSSINSAIGDSIEEDIRDAVENQVEKNNK